MHEVRSHLLIRYDLYTTHVFESIAEFVLLPYHELAQNCIVLHVLSGSEELHLGGVEFYLFQTSFRWRPHLSLQLSWFFYCQEG